MQIHYDPQKADRAVGLVETNSIARGMEVLDVMLKEASIEVLLSSPTSPGHYINLITGDVESVSSSLRAGEDRAGSTMRDRLFLPNLHRDVLDALYKVNQVAEDEMEALGVLETSTQASLLGAADRAAKVTEVRFIQVHLGVGIGGKAFYVLTGTFEAVEEAMYAGVDYARDRDCLVEEVLIGNADPMMLPILLQNKLPHR